ncbi:MAG: AraC family transcriptional regulator [Chitinophaga sp.]|uniref:helix-turn-helix domain-containing protein n=1 Tax=Chitinophaga sp. TaxID=1869181 RepID=UPI0025C6AA22|nr:helix-turn-helix domain-containing protein [Chitinophaga sp.]MBV8254941.1 AraC family transcriptional regulator [Chitinophaga sp.]
MSPKKITRASEIRATQTVDSHDNFSLFTHREWQPKAPTKSSFAAFSREEKPVKQEVGTSRCDYYKITLITRGKGIYTINGTAHNIDGPTIVFLHPEQVKNWESTSDDQAGHYCLFTKELFEQQEQELLQYPLLQVGVQPVYKLTNTQADYLSSIFRQLQREYHENSAFKQEAILIYLKLLLLEGRRVAQDLTPSRVQTAAQQLSQRFTDKLEKQFPIEYPNQQISLKTAKEFAALLNTHPNHLNACVKHSTGRTISEHIRQRILLEAKLLLIHTDWQIAEIAWCLGFEDPGNFTHFFRNHCSQSPLAYRSH